MRVEVRGHRGHHLAVKPTCQFPVENGAMVAIGDDLDHGIALEPLQLVFEKLDGSLEVEGVHAAGDHMNLAAQPGTAIVPVPVQDQADVVSLPCSGDFRIDGAGVPVPQLTRLTIATRRTEDRLERAELSARSEGLLQLREAVVKDGGDSPHARSAGSCPRDRGTCSHLFRKY